MLRRAIVSYGRDFGRNMSRRWASNAAAAAEEGPFRKANFEMTKIELPPHQTVYEPLSPGEFPEGSVRTGVIGLKVGMMPEWDVFGVRHALTVVKLEDVQVVQRKTVSEEGYSALQIGAGEAKRKRVTKPMLGHFARAGVVPKRKLVEFRVTEDALLDVGTMLYASHFAPGQFVDVTGISKGKGFAGTMKRWNFGGQAASHGVSKTHRALGSTGTINAGRVFRNKKMAGRLGNERVTTLGIQVYKIDLKRNLIYLLGAAPGAPGGWIYIRDSVRKPPTPELGLPFPTWQPDDEFWAKKEIWDAPQQFSPMQAALLRDRGELNEDHIAQQPPFEIVMPHPEQDPTVDRSVAGDEY